MHNKLLSILAISIALIGCGDAEEGGSESHAPDTLQVSVTDTIGVMAGDTALVFGKITDATFTRDGDLYILDGLQGCIRTFSGECEYLGTAGRIGSGPGEYQYPRSFSYQSSGGLVVCDWGGISVTYLTSDLEFDTLLTGFRHIAPDRIVPSLNETCVGMTLEYSMEDDRPSGETQIARFGRDTEP